MLQHALVWAAVLYGCSVVDAKDRKHHWPHVHGNVGSYSVSKIKAPRDLSKPAWRWHHPSGQYGTTVVGGPVIDDELNIYIVEIKGLHKFSPDGELLWSALPEPYYEVSFPDGPCLWGNSVFVSTTQGELIAFNLADGKVQWKKQYFESTGGDSKYVTCHDGVVVSGTDHAHQDGGGSKHLVGADAITGDEMWRFKTDVPSWNTMAMFTDDDSFVIQDWDSKAYRIGLHNGTLLWKDGGRTPLAKTTQQSPYSDSWTDGGLTMGADGQVYAVSGKQHQHSAGTPFSGGGIHTHRLSDGKLLWEREVAHPVLTWPVAAKLGSDSDYTVLVFPSAGSFGIPDRDLIKAFLAHGVGIGVAFAVPFVLLVSLCLTNCCPGSKKLNIWVGLIVLWLALILYHQRQLLHYRFMEGTPSIMQAFNAKTGELKWTYELDFMKRKVVRGDEEGDGPRMATPWRGRCVPVAYSSPTVDGNGVIHIGHMSGKFFSIKDWNDDGVIQPDEVSEFDAEAAFLHSGPAFAPGVFAVTTCDSLWVWRM